MPELPEAETIVRGIHPHVAGRTIEEIEVVRPDLLRVPAHRFQDSLRGRRIDGAGRRGKTVLLNLDAGGVLVVNLGMTGSLLVPRPGRPDPTHPGIRFQLGGVGSTTLVYNDSRRFGALRVFSRSEYRDWSATLGPEPLSRSYSARDLGMGLARSRSPVRSWLLDQSHIAGVGNIYANEALFRAGVRPTRPANQISFGEARHLHRWLRRILRRAIRAKGTTIRDYRNAEGESGMFAPQLDVYGREGSPCRRCGCNIERLVLSNRSAFYCPECQPE